MKIKLFILVVSYGAVLGCQSEQTKKPTAAETAAVETGNNQVASACYRHSSGKDSILLHLNPVGDSIKGDLIYAFYEKDNNTGTIAGQMKGDTLFAVYTFHSEGKVSAREVAFLKKGNTWTEGYGEMTDNGRKTVFTNKAALDFDNRATFKKVNCQIGAHGCLTSFGYTWSASKGECLPLLTAGIRLNPLEHAETGKASAYIVFSESRQQAELFLPAQEAILLNRRGLEGQHHWENGAWKLYPWKGYVLMQAGKAVYAGQ